MSSPASRSFPSFWITWIGSFESEGFVVSPAGSESNSPESVSLRSISSESFAVSLGICRDLTPVGLRGADGRRGGARTTVRDPRHESAPDLVDRDFARAAPNRLWACDLKYIQTGQGFLFLAAVQDVFSRRIIGWSMRDDLKSELVLDALGMAVTARGGDAAGVVAHSDHGSQAPSLVYGAYAKQSGIDLSMGSIGDPWDNALAESFFASLEKELLRRERFATREQARLRVFWYIECFYNPRRRHSSLGMLSPIDYEQRHQQEAIAA